MSISIEPDLQEAVIDQETNEQKLQKTIDYLVAPEREPALQVIGEYMRARRDGNLNKGKIAEDIKEHFVRFNTVKSKGQKDFFNESIGGVPTYSRRIDFIRTYSQMER